LEESRTERGVTERKENRKKRQ
jgi:hypothetical protein